MARDDERLNRTFWETTSAEYQTEHADELEAAPLAWGTWRMPESDVGALGDLSGARRARARVRWWAVVDRARAARRASDRPRLVRGAARARGPGRRPRPAGAGERRVGAVRERVVRRRVLRSRGDDVRRSGLQRAGGGTGASPGRSPGLLPLDGDASHVPRRRLGGHDDLASHGIRDEAGHRRRVGRLRAPPRRVDPPVPPSRPRRRRPHRAATAAGGDDDLSLVRLLRVGEPVARRRDLGRPRATSCRPCAVRRGRGSSCRGTRRARAGACAPWRPGRR